MVKGDVIKQKIDKMFFSGIHDDTVSYVLSMMQSRAILENPDS